MSDDLVEMARLAQHDERMATGALYGDLADRIEELEAKLAKAVDFVRRLERFAVQNKDGFLIEKAQEALAELTGGQDG